VGTIPSWAGPYIIGRNGQYEITALEIMQQPWRYEDEPSEQSLMNIRGIGKRGNPINGGFFCLRAEDIDALCKAWIEARGGLAIMPDDDEVTALVTMYGGIADRVIIGRDQELLRSLGKEHVGDADPDQWEYYLECVELVAGESVRFEGSP